MYIGVDFWIWGPYARYGGFKGFGILLHVQLSYWGPGTQLLENFESVMYIAYMGGLLLQSQVLQPGAASGGSEFLKMGCFNRVLPPAGQNPGKWGVSTGCCLRRVRILKKLVFQFCLRRVRILENDVFQLGSASGGSESWKMMSLWSIQGIQ